MTPRALAATGILAALLLDGVASRAQAEGVAISGDPGGCPSPAQVLAALQATLPQTQAANGSDGFSVQLLDEGESHLVLAAGAAKRFEDRARRCDERARKAALFIALRLDAAPAPSSTPAPTAPASPTTAPSPSPDAATEAAPEPAPLAPPPTRAARDVNAGVRWPSVELELAGLFAGSPGSESSVTGGGTARLVFGSRYVAGLVGLSGSAPVVLAGAIDARMWRLPFELGVRGRLLWHHTVIALDLAFDLGVQQTEGIDVTGSTVQTRMEAGFLGRAHVAYYVTERVAPFLEIGATGLFTRYRFTVPDRENAVGETPRFWVNVYAGLAVRLQ